jgi:hypothetical protein
MKSDGGLRALERQYLVGAQWTSIETGGSAHGVPDMEYCYPRGKQGWLENKMTHGWAVKIRPAQVGWIEWRVRMGGTVFVATRRINAASRADELWVHHGRDVEALQDHGLRGAEPLLRSLGGPAGWDWEAFKNILIKSKPI